jgi:hypothetical protein
VAERHRGHRRPVVEQDLVAVPLLRGRHARPPSAAPARFCARCLAPGASARRPPRGAPRAPAAPRPSPPAPAPGAAAARAWLRRSRMCSVRLAQPTASFLESAEKRMAVMPAMLGSMASGTRPMTWPPPNMVIWALSPATARTLLLPLQSSACTSVPSFNLTSRRGSADSGAHTLTTAPQHAASSSDVFHAWAPAPGAAAAAAMARGASAPRRASPGVAAGAPPLSCCPDGVAMHYSTLCPLDGAIRPTARRVPRKIATDTAAFTPSSRLHRPARRVHGARGG